MQRLFYFPDERILELIDKILAYFLIPIHKKQQKQQQQPSSNSNTVDANNFQKNSTNLFTENSLIKSGTSVHMDLKSWKQLKKQLEDFKSIECTQLEDFQSIECTHCGTLNPSPSLNQPSTKRPITQSIECTLCGTLNPTPTLNQPSTKRPITQNIECTHCGTLNPSPSLNQPSTKQSISNCSCLENNLSESLIYEREVQTIKMQSRPRTSSRACDCQDIGDSINNQTSLVQVGGRKVIHTEWALTKINHFDDCSKTYEILSGPIESKIKNIATKTETVFVMLPGGGTVSYDCRET